MYRFLYLHVFSQWLYLLMFRIKKLDKVIENEPERSMEQCL